MLKHELGERSHVTLLHQGLELRRGHLLTSTSASQEPTPPEISLPCPLQLMGYQRRSLYRGAYHDEEQRHKDKREEVLSWAMPWNHVPQPARITLPAWAAMLRDHLPRSRELFSRHLANRATAHGPRLPNLSTLLSSNAVCCP